MIEIKNVTKIYGKEGTESSVIALRDVTLSLKSGRFIAIIGESGSGKSTLLNLIGALDVPTKGNIIIHGVDITKFNEVQAASFRRNNLGFVFQNFYLDTDFNVVKNVEIPLILQGADKKKREEKAKSLLIKLGLKSKIHCRITDLSGGQLQKVCIARALINEAKLILADEPTGNLDAKNGRAVMQLLKDLTKTGITVIVVTHNLSDISLFDEVICLKDGALSEIDL